MFTSPKFIVSIGAAAAVVVLSLTPLSASARQEQASTTYESKTAAERSTPAPTITVRGVVYDELGTPLPGAGVLVKGTTSGTVTDLDGRYELKVAPTETLVISFIGYKDQEIAVNGRSQINVSLVSEATSLDDVVVIGYGSVKKANLTGAVDVIDSKTFENRIAANVDQMLLGTTPSVSIATLDGAPYRNSNNLSGYQIRGAFQSIGDAPVGPDFFGSLVLIDGVEGDPSSLNPNDIESVSVLKDAAASAIYGSRGAFGVMLITTKNPGKEEKVTVTYSGNFNLVTPTAMPELLTDGEQYMKIREEAYYNFNGKNKTQSNLWPTNVNYSDIINGYQDAGKQAALVGGVYTAPDGTYEYYGHTDWFKEIYKSHTTSQIHNLSVSGSSGKVSYLLSGRLYDYDGIYVGKSDPYETYNLRSKTGVQIVPWLRIDENLEYAYDDVQYAIGSNGDGISAPQVRMQAYGSPNWVPFNPDGTFTKAGAQILSGLIGDAYDPLAPNRKGKTKKTTSFRTTTGLTATFFNNTLRLKADYSYRSKREQRDDKDTGFYYFDRQGVPTFNRASKPNIQSLKRQVTTTTWKTTNETAEYENTFGRHWVKGLIGFNYEERDRDVMTMKKYGLDYWDANAGNPWAYALGTMGDADASALTGYMKSSPDYFKLKHWRNMGTFFRLNYSFDDRYLVEFNGRYDGSSVFVNKYQWGFFPSVSAAWRPTQEHWWHVDPRWVSSLKFRISYGELGDCMSAGAYNTEDTFSADMMESRVINGSSTLKTYNIPDKTGWQYGWSTVRNFNVGADASFFNNKLDITYEYFIRRNLDMLTSGGSHTDTFGQKDDKGNNADMSTYGWELSAKFNHGFILASKPAHVGVRASIGDSFSVIDRFVGNEEKKISSFQYRVGERLGEIWGFRVNPDCPIFQTQEQIDNAFGPGKPYKINAEFEYDSKNSVNPGDIWLLDLNNDGEINYENQTLDKHGDQEIIGNRLPRFPFSFNIDLGWGDWYLSAGFTGILHQDFCVYGGFLGINSYGKANGPMTKWFTDQYWTPTNTGAYFPRLSNGNRVLRDKTQYLWNVTASIFPIDRYVLDAGYINLQNLQFGYNIPHKLLKKIGLSAAKVYFSGENLWNWSPLYRTLGRDYDVTTLTYGGDDPTEDLNWFTGYGYQYPKLRSFSLGITITY